MVFEVLGQNLLTLIVRSKYRGIHIDNVRLIMRQVLALFLRDIIAIITIIIIIYLGSGGAIFL